MSTFLDIFRWSRSGKGTDRGPANTGPRPNPHTNTDFDGSRRHAHRYTTALNEALTRTELG